MAEYEAYDEAYAFDLVLAVKESSTGKVFLAQDSGCSCPVPFEDHVWPTDFTEVRSEGEARRFVDTHYPAGIKNSYYRRQREPLADFLRNVKEALA